MGKTFAVSISTPKTITSEGTSVSTWMPGLSQEGEECRGDEKRSDHERDLVDAADQKDQ